MGSNCGKEDKLLENQKACQIRYTRVVPRKYSSLAYPSSIPGEEILIEVRILCVADDGVGNNLLLKTLSLKRVNFFIEFILFLKVG